MRIDIVTLFPNMFKGPFSESIVKRAINKELVEISFHQLRDFAKDKRKTVDGRPFGGGTGMVLMIEPIYEAIKKLKKTKSKIILVTPQGKTFNQEIAQKLAKEKHLVFICGHYEGFDERVREHLINEELSIGDFILTGGEIPTMAMVDSIVRLIPSVLKNKEATTLETFSEVNLENQGNKRLIEYPQYTKPVSFKNWKVPKILTSGNHQKIDEWKKEQSFKKTMTKRPDLLD